ncbi:tetratricopeptide repeat protein [Marinibactrum halimedae]|uniref:Tetratricopeptide repeat protein n=1 Tax=Marinibactrum halimedae TaxID=1444977 RepID=A0AA37WL18_9GAMM|nr:tetratricopeptide repeat protein [Marinibactrum halimedae]MCD9457431.1 tetratricopeptide repeat protein [Marinibactrum halimedae]GLS25519.1 hypothetical protein GCM10007877_12330 [Marinibactrum halimedae]
MKSNKLIKQAIFFTGLLPLLPACQLGGVKTLGDLEYKEEAEEPIEFEQVSYEDVRSEYQELMSLFKEDDIKEQIQRRIADVYMLEGSQQQIDQKEYRSYYDEAIKSYHEILKKYPNSPDNADVLYQLARAYELDGHQDEAMKMLTQLAKYHPAYKNIAEVHFRVGDIYFNRQEYKNAQKEYEIVTQYTDRQLLMNAHYMLGWAYYKQFKYSSSIRSFAQVLALIYTPESSIETVKDGDQQVAESISEEESLLELDASLKSLEEDSLNSMSLALSKSGGPDMIAQVASLQGKSYLWKVYDHLGEYYLEKERFEDSAATFRHFVKRNRFSQHAPILHKKMIESYADGGFSLLALEEKEQYVSHYGISSEYASINGETTEEVLSALKVYIDELASHYHSRAQKLVTKASDDQKELDEAAESVIPSPQQIAKIETLKKQAKESFYKATQFYSEYALTFPQDPRLPEILYLMAEAYFESDRYKEAAESYEKVAYGLNEFKDDRYRANSGYAAIVSYQTIIDGADDEATKRQWQGTAVESMLRFAEVFHTDERSPAVLTNAAEYLFGLENYQKALDVSSNLIASNENLDKNLKKTAHGIAAHSLYNLKRYAEAEGHYLSQRLLVEENSEEYTRISERLANTIYKNSQQLVERSENTEAIEQLLKVKVLTPEAAVRVDAQFNAVKLMLGAERWVDAINELLELQTIFPDHEMAPEFQRKIAYAYEKNESWKKAGQAYYVISQTDSDDIVKREALFLSAEMYEKGREFEQAIKLFKRYAKTYEKPFGVRMESRYRLAVLYEKIDDISKQQFWLRRIIEGDQKGGSERTERSRWLGAWANIKYGDYFANEFRARKLTSALATSLPKKNEFLTDAVKRYEAAADYGVFEFMTMANYKISELYRQLAFELRGAPLPAGLSSEERSVYEGFIEEQAFPLQQMSIELHMTNVERGWSGDFDEWINRSFEEMAELNSQRFGKSERMVSYGDEIR